MERNKEEWDYLSKMDPTPELPYGGYIDRVMFYQRCPHCTKVRPAVAYRCVEWDGLKTKIVDILHTNHMVAHIAVHHPERI